MLVYAWRPDTPRHAACRSWLEAQLRSAAPFGVAPQVLASVLRICTHPKIFVKPDAPADVTGFCQALLQSPNAIPVMPGERHWAIFGDLCAATGATGNLVQDAWLAALAIESGCEWVTTDGDFARFAGLNWRMPD